MKVACRRLACAVLRTTLIVWQSCLWALAPMAQGADVLQDGGGLTFTEKVEGAALTLCIMLILAIVRRRLLLKKQWQGNRKGRALAKYAAAGDAAAVLLDNQSHEIQPQATADHVG
jgi:hypothetical protein